MNTLEWPVEECGKVYCSSVAEVRLAAAMLVIRVWLVKTVSEY